MNVPYRSDDELEIYAQTFLAEHSPESLEPTPLASTPIEIIIEKKLGLEIVPFRGYRDRYGIDGSLSTDLSNITVDEHVFDKLPNRLNFTLAHEVGHYVLHREQITELFLDTPGEWCTHILEMHPREYKRMEIQAHQFAGRILVPTNKLITALDEAKRKLWDETDGLTPDELSPSALSYMAGYIADRFQVSTQVVEIRIRKFI